MNKRRQLLAVGLGMLGCRFLPVCAEPASRLPTANGMRAEEKPKRHWPQGHLVIIGGAEDRTGERIVLRRFIELTGRSNPTIGVISAASAFPEFVWGRYDLTFSELGINRHFHIDVNVREDCDDPRWTELISQSDSIFLTGGDQRRLATIVGGTAVHRAIAHAYHVKGICIAGTSAGAAVMSRNMLAGRSLSEGLGLLHGVIIDQHFSQRGRLSRLASSVARNPDLIGIGIDEDTALIVSRGMEFEVLGAGGITLVDGRALEAPVAEHESRDVLELPGLRILRIANYRSNRTAPDGAVPGQRDLSEEYAAAAQLLRDVLPMISR